MKPQDSDPSGMILSTFGKFPPLTVPANEIDHQVEIGDPEEGEIIINDYDDLPTDVNPSLQRPYSSTPITSLALTDRASTPNVDMPPQSNQDVRDHFRDVMWKIRTGNGTINSIMLNSALTFALIRRTAFFKFVVSWTNPKLAEKWFADRARPRGTISFAKRWARFRKEFGPIASKVGPILKDRLRQAPKNPWAIAVVLIITLSAVLTMALGRKKLLKDQKKAAGRGDPVPSIPTGMPSRPLGTIGANSWLRGLLSTNGYVNKRSVMDMMDKNNGYIRKMILNVPQEATGLHPYASTAFMLAICAYESNGEPNPPRNYSEDAGCMQIAKVNWVPWLAEYNKRTGKNLPFPPVSDPVAYADLVSSYLRKWKVLYQKALAGNDSLIGQMILGLTVFIPDDWNLIVAHRVYMKGNSTIDFGIHLKSLANRVATTLFLMGADVEEIASHIPTSSTNAAQIINDLVQAADSITTPSGLLDNYSVKIAANGADSSRFTFFAPTDSAQGMPELHPDMTDDSGLTPDSVQ